MRKATTITFEGFVKYDRTLFEILFFVIVSKVAAGSSLPQNLKNYLPAHHPAIFVYAWA